MNLDEIAGHCVKYDLVGSRVTCQPPPVDTDQDVLVLCTPEHISALIGILLCDGYDLDGSAIADPIDHLANPDTFQSFSKDDLNLILTECPVFYKKFMAATFVAKRLNLMKKSDRISLFQAVLYANAMDVKDA